MTLLILRLLGAMVALVVALNLGAYAARRDWPSLADRATWSPTAQRAPGVDRGKAGAWHYVGTGSSTLSLGHAGLVFSGTPTYGYWHAGSVIHRQELDAAFEGTAGLQRRIGRRERQEEPEQ